MTTAEARQWTGVSTPELQQLLQGTGLDANLLNQAGVIDNVVVATGGAPLQVGSWLVRMPSGEVINLTDRAVVLLGAVYHESTQSPQPAKP